MASITFTSLDFTGTPDEEDIRAAQLIVDLENEVITAQNVVLAAEDPPGTPIPLLGRTGAELKTNYLALLVRKNC